MALPRNSRRTASIVTTVVSGAGRTHASDAIRRPPGRRIIRPAPVGQPRPTLLVKGQGCGCGWAKFSDCPRRCSLACRRVRHMLSGTTEAGRHGDGPWSIVRDGEVAMIRRNWNFCAAIAAAAALLATGGTAMAASLGGPLELADEGSFFVNGVTTLS